MPMLRGILAVLMVFSLGYGCIASEEEALPRATAQFTSRPPTLDGKCDEGEWGGSVPVFFPSTKSKEHSTPPCEVRILWDHDALYVCFLSKETTPIFGNIKPGDPLYTEDVYELFVDCAGDSRQYYEIQASPNGQIFVKNYVLTAAPKVTPDGRLEEEFSSSRLWRYNVPPPEKLLVGSRIDPNTHLWTLEMSIPAAFLNRHLGRKTFEPGTMRLNLVRHDWSQPLEDPNRKAQFLYWAPVLPGHPHLSPTKMGFLELEKVR